MADKIPTEVLEEVIFTSIQKMYLIFVTNKEQKFEPSNKQDEIEKNGIIKKI